MQSLALYLLFAVASCRPQQQQGIALWGTCNGMGVNGPLPCSEGSCICKDLTFSQCRTQIDGSWADKPEWQCQKPGDQPTGVLSSSSGGSTSGGVTSNSNPLPNANSYLNADSTRDTDIGTSSSTNDDTHRGITSKSGTGSNILSHLAPNAPGKDATTNQEVSNIGSPNDTSNPKPSPSPAVDTLGSSTQRTSGDARGGTIGGTTGGSPGASDLSQLGNSSATVGGCAAVEPPAGWKVASTTFYGYMGTSCMCGNADYNQAPWQANTGPSLGIGQGYYSGAVNNIVFGDSTIANPSQQPNCGQKCGQCYDLVTSGVNAYNDGAPGGSQIKLMVVDACFNTAGAPNWCSSNSAAGQDDFGCGVHFDIDTDPTRGDVPVVGMDGTEWTHGGQMVYYRESDCPADMVTAFQRDCAPHCKAK